MREHSSNKVDDFIKGFYFNDDQLIDDLIEYHSSSNPQPGISYHNGNLGVNEIKQSLDCHLLDETLFKRYTSRVIEAVAEYRKCYPHVDSTANWGITEDILIQRYDPPTGGFNNWHHEGGSIEGSNRHLVFITYLTDNDEGATDFLYQNKSIYPERGLTVIFPTAFTHTHKGNTVMKSTKIIATGWLSFTE